MDDEKKNDPYYRIVYSTIYMILTIAVEFIMLWAIYVLLGIGDMWSIKVGIAWILALVLLKFHFGNKND